MTRPIAITGVGVVSPLGTGADAFRDGLLSGRSGVGAVTAFDVSGCRARRAASVAGFDAAQWIAPMKMRRMDNTSRFAVSVVRQALDAGHYPLPVDGDDRAGVVMGTYTAGGQHTTEYLAALHAGGATGAPALLFSSTVANAPASLAALEYRLRGPNITVSTKEASGLSAIVTATDLLRLGRAEALVAGGVDALFEIFYRVHDRFGVFDPSDRSPVPFDHNHNGFVLGEGGYALLLEDADTCRARGARTLGHIVGVGAGSASLPINQWPDDPVAIVRTMRAALADAEIEASQIGAVYAAANGAARLDDVEAEALSEVFAGGTPVVTSIKGAIGESAAASAASCVAAIVCGERVPALPASLEPAPSTRRLRLASAAATLAAPYVIVNGIASGGALFSVVIRIGQG
ncbi:MAG: beta-ketoacyl synthase N-terminal-like domain-containing protein [Acidobacteriota bacterium]